MEKDTSLSITCLPDEIIGLILQNTNCRDILNFGSTCKHFNELVNTNQWIWKGIYRDLLPPKIADIITKYDNGNWLDAMKRYFSVKKSIYKELNLMSAKFYGRTDELRLEDLQVFFKIGLSHSENYHYMIYILLSLIKWAKITPLQNYKASNLTHLYYAKIVVRFLVHTFLALKWAQKHNKNELSPDIVVNFFVQWTDPFTLRSQDDIDECINILVRKVDNMFPADPQAQTLPEKIAKGSVSEIQVLEAISHVIYIQHKMILMGGANVYGLDIVKAIKNRCHNLVVAAVLYQAVARKCGVKCDLFAFKKHLFLEWQDPTKQIYRIELQTGAIVPQSVCPYASSTFRQEYQYEPTAFVQYIVSAFLVTMTAITNSLTRNARWLVDFLTNSHNVQNIYRDFLPYAITLMDLEHDPDLAIPITLECLHPSHMAVLEKLSTMERMDSIPPFIREIEVKPHDPKVTYAVGMVCYHRKLDYICVIRDWYTKCAPDWRHRVEIQDLEYGIVQPFYTVIAIDQSERYVPQECLVPADRPSRLIHMEDLLGKEFSYFNGFAYLPNEEKLMEYPEDGPIREIYQARAESVDYNILRNASFPSQ